MITLDIFNYKKKDIELENDRFLIKKVFRHCMAGLTEDEKKLIDPYLLGFNEEEYIESELNHIEKKKNKQALELGINLKEVRRQFYERVGFEHSITIKYHLDRYISEEELKEINAKLKTAMPDMFPYELSETQVRAMYVWGREKFATEDDITKSKELLNLDYKIKSMKRG